MYYEKLSKYYWTLSHCRVRRTTVRASFARKLKSALPHRAAASRRRSFRFTRLIICSGFGFVLSPVVRCVYVCLYIYMCVCARASWCCCLSIRIHSTTTTTPTLTLTTTLPPPTLIWELCNFVGRSCRCFFFGFRYFIFFLFYYDMFVCWCV